MQSCNGISVRIANNVRSSSDCVPVGTEKKSSLSYILLFITAFWMGLYVFVGESILWDIKPWDVQLDRLRGPATTCKTRTVSLAQREKAGDGR
jgi:hypothetical protein